ncbi:uncharacterized protein LOC120701800 [Panicum virgatum]|uniref:uncharacterized protein LOC120701800 n=1 Tax=Panicum virgatum TaxID=38727 RepID=UPI0019D5977B|nr:uncharacterized protein LOC120701800 [Panicum virgatum]
MDQFPDGIHVRMRSLVRGLYLYADEDGVGVSLSPRRASVNAAWRVHLVQRGDFHYVLLCGAAYGRYLALSPAMEPPPGLRGRRAVQRDYDEADLHAVMWRAIGVVGDVDDGVVVLRHRGFTRSLRANGRYRRWHTCVTVDDDIGNFGERSTMMYWIVEEIPPRPAPPPPPTPTVNLGGPGLISLFTWRAQPSVEPLRTIRYVRVNDQGQFNQQGWATFQFYGRSLYLLICRLLYILDEPIFIGDEGNFSITVCVQAGIYGRRTPLVIDLPRCEEPMDIFVLTTGSPVLLLRIV